MTHEEQWKKNLDEAVLITTNLMLRHADVVKEHEQWLRDHTLAMLEHNRASERHDEEMREIRAALLDLTKRPGGGGNGHGQT